MNTSNGNIYLPSCSQILDRSIVLNQNKRKLRNSFLWGAVNFLLLAVILYDLSQTCPLYLNYYHYIEYTLIVVFIGNILYYIVKIVQSSIVTSEQILITLEQKKLLGVKDSDPNYKIVETPTRSFFNTSASASGYGSTPMNVTALSWRSNVSLGESMNYSLSSPSWSYLKGSLDFSSQSSPKSEFMSAPTFRENINDEQSLNEYLKEYEEAKKINNIVNKSQPTTTNLLSSFWKNPVTETGNDIGTVLGKVQYQLSSQSPTSKSSSPNKVEDKTSPQVPALAVWTRINVNSVALTQWNENLRMWISQTILNRLVREFDSIDKSLEKHGLSDIKIGSVGLDRLRKTAHMMPIAQFIPSLATLIPFLEFNANQEYVVKRIRELEKGGCMSQFKWNGGSEYNGKDWDDSLPTDCAIIMHLLAAYLDTQLMPLPNMPDVKAFSGHHYIKFTEKMPTLTSNSLFIHQVSEKPPHYRVVVGVNVYEMVKGYNNLFHSILFFIYHANILKLGMLGRTNLGRAGINILWIIDAK